MKMKYRVKALYYWFDEYEYVIEFCPDGWGEQVWRKLRSERTFKRWFKAWWHCRKLNRGARLCQSLNV